MRIAGGKYKNHKLITPKGNATRPTSEKLRQTVFNICQHTIEDATFLDVFAGSGAMGLEALSRGASHATFLEKNRLALQAIHKNLTNLQLSDHATVLPGDALLSLKKLAQKNASFDLIYIDPPYGQKVPGSSQTLLDATLAFIDTSNLLTPSGILFLEEATAPTVALTHLTLEKQRPVGDSHLYQYTQATNY
ncbi:16S rRNA (guanine(966)-N(2))-methyltransferase RsmD [Simkania sp.]|uniref:16S rRNA (guanine(966)-N(2))-methyltransferase RsmD n=1 Tax=Simkania sp. TaxID=34094 RepID=UPI003B51550B